LLASHALLLQHAGSLDATGSPRITRLHVGGVEQRKGWSILNTVPGPNVDIVGSCTDLSFIPSATVQEVYSSHCFEHLGYNSCGQLLSALREVHRILVPGGCFKCSVPDLSVLCSLFANPPAISYYDQSIVPSGVNPVRWQVMRMIYGGQMDAWDFHKVGFDRGILESFLRSAGFLDVEQVENFELFNDTSKMRFLGIPISLNVIAWKQKSL